MGVLNPSHAAAIASGVYLLRESGVAELREIQAPLGGEGMFAVADNGRFTGKSGGGLFKKISGFGYVAAGEGAFAGEVLIATRGTAQTVDWLSNLNIGMQLGPSSHLVHAGFHDGAIGVTLTVSATLLDQLAWLLAKGAAASKEVAGLVSGLMKAIFRFLVRVTQAVTDLTVGFLRWVLDLLFTSVRVVAERAVTLLN